MDDGGEWKSRKIFNEACSDVAVAAYPEHGEYDEIGIITPFHGNDFRILRREAKGWRETFSLNDSFGHGIWGGKLNGSFCYLIGYRAGSRGIYCVESVEGKYTVTPVDLNVGSANLTVFQWKGKICIGSANRESNSITIYSVSADD